MKSRALCWRPCEVQCWLLLSYWCPTLRSAPSCWQVGLVCCWKAAFQGFQHEKSTCLAFSIQRISPIAAAVASIQQSAVKITLQAWQSRPAPDPSCGLGWPGAWLRCRLMCWTHMPLALTPPRRLVEWQKAPLVLRASAQGPFSSVVQHGQHAVATFCRMQGHGGRITAWFHPRSRGWRRRCYCTRCSQIVFCSTCPALCPDCFPCICSEPNTQSH